MRRKDMTAPKQLSPSGSRTIGLVDWPVGWGAPCAGPMKIKGKSRAEATIRPIEVLGSGISAKSAFSTGIDSSFRRNDEEESPFS
jgi:hypothetical protein